MEPIIAIIIWTKPVCGQCDMTKKILVEEFTGLKGLSKAEVSQEIQGLIDLGYIAVEDLTAEENIEQLTYMKSLGYASAPLTEYKGSITPGFNVAELKEKASQWKLDHPWFEDRA